MIGLRFKVLLPFCMLYKISTMKDFLSKIFIVVLVLAMACKKDDPVPLGAQVNAKLLAGEAGKSKTWKLISIKLATNTNPYTLATCFTDNLYIFSNNAAQDYQATEGATRFDATGNCVAGADTSIEKGTWAFTLDGILINISVDEISSFNGLFSPDAIVADLDANGDPFGFLLTYPYPATVVKLTATDMILEMNNVYGSTTYKYTLTFSAL
ncbi:hypothetical protein BH10BAC4_BH10BAC4_15110 [soil metagenome]